MDTLPASRAMSGMTAYFGIFKEPRGFLRLLQFFFAIFAFATACSGGSSLSIKDSGKSDAITAEWSYPYKLRDVAINTNLNNTQDTLSLSNDIKPSAEFFVFTGVTSMLISLALLVVYVLFDRQYRNDERFSLVDLLVTLIWTIFWIAGSSAWAQGVSNLRTQTSIDYVKDLVSECSDSNRCTDWTSGTYANVTVSVIFGFLNFFLWTSCIWFVYKETRFFKSRTAQQQPAPASNFSNIGAPNMSQQPPPMRMPGTLS